MTSVSVTIHTTCDSIDSHVSSSGSDGSSGGTVVVIGRDRGDGVVGLVMARGVSGLCTAGSGCGSGDAVFIVLLAEAGDCVSVMAAAGGGGTGLLFL